MIQQSGKGGAEKNAGKAGKQSPTGPGPGISRQRGGDLAPDPAHKATEDSGREVNRNRPDKAN
jgi:hypothetical protein